MTVRKEYTYTYEDRQKNLLGKITNRTLRGICQAMRATGSYDENTRGAEFMKNYKPFILEFLVFLFVFFAIAVAIACGEYIQIKIKPGFLSYALLIFLLLSILYPYRRLVRNGVAAIVDCLCKTKRETEAELIESAGGFASTFSDKFTDEGTGAARPEPRYWYTFRNKEEKNVLQSAALFDVVPRKKYRIAYGKYSKILLSVSEL